MGTTTLTHFPYSFPSFLHSLFSVVAVSPNELFKDLKKVKIKAPKEVSDVLVDLGFEKKNDTFVFTFLGDISPLKLKVFKIHSSFEYYELSLKIGEKSSKCFFAFLDSFHKFSILDESEEIVLLVPIFRDRNRILFPRHNISSLRNYRKIILQDFTKEKVTKPIKISNHYIIPLLSDLPRSNTACLRDYTESIWYFGILFALIFALINTEREIFSEVSQKLFRPWVFSVHGYLSCVNSLESLTENFIQKSKEIVREKVISPRRVKEMKWLEVINEEIRKFGKIYVEGAGIRRERIGELSNLHYTVVLVMFTLLGILVTIMVSLISKRVEMIP